MPLIEREPRGKWSSFRFQIDTETRQDLLLYCKFSDNKTDHVIRGALRLLFKTDSEFGAWREQHKNDPPDSPTAVRRQKTAAPTQTSNQASATPSRKSE